MTMPWAGQGGCLEQGTRSWYWYEQPVLFQWRLGRNAPVRYQVLVYILSNDAQ